jgi:plastocyanin
MNRLLLVALFASAGTAAAQDKLVTLKGQVKFNGDKAPEVKIVDVMTDKAVCCKDGPLGDTQVLVDPKSLGVQNVIVWLRPDTTDRKDTFPLDKIPAKLKDAKPVAHVVDQPKCQFEPRVLAARAGDTVVFKNSATIPHNTNYSSDAESFNVNIPAASEKKLDKPLVAQTTPVTFKCDVHPWMAGRLRVFDHPYFATTDKDGKFEIKDVPEGKWRIVYWHEGGFHKGRDGAIGFPIEASAAKPTLELEPIKLELPKAN